MPKLIKTVYLRCVHFVVCKLCFNEVDINKSLKQKKKALESGPGQILINSGICPRLYVVIPEWDYVNNPHTSLWATLAMSSLDVFPLAIMERCALLNLQKLLCLLSKRFLYFSQGLIFLILPDVSKNCYLNNNDSNNNNNS